MHVHSVQCTQSHSRHESQQRPHQSCQTCSAWRQRLGCWTAPARSLAWRAVVPSWPSYNRPSSCSIHHSAREKRITNYMYMYTYNVRVHDVIRLIFSSHGKTQRETKTYNIPSNRSHNTFRTCTCKSHTVECMNTDTISMFIHTCTRTCITHS